MPPLISSFYLVVENFPVERAVLRVPDLFQKFSLARNCPTVCVTCAGAGTAKPSSQKMIRRRKLLEIAAESPASGARFVGKNWGKENTLPKNQNHAFNWLDFTRAIIFYKPDFAIEDEQELKERKSRELAETFAKNWFCKKFTVPEKMNLAKKPEPNLSKLFLKPWSQFWKPDFAKKNASQKNKLCQMKTFACQNFAWKAWSQF